MTYAITLHGSDFDWFAVVVGVGGVMHETLHFATVGACLHAVAQWIAEQEAA